MISTLKNKMPGKHHKLFSIPKCFIIFLMCLGFFYLSGCAKLSDPETSQTYHKDSIGIVDQTHTVEQTFYTSQFRIDGLYLWLGSTPENNSGNGVIFIELYNPAEEPSLYASASIKAGKFQLDQPIHVEFSPLRKVKSKSFKVVIRSSGAAIQVFGRAEDAYAHGRAFQDSYPLPGDIAFRIIYQYDFESFFHDIRSTSNHLNLVTVAVLFFFVPGYLLLSVIKIKQFFNVPEIISLSIGWSITLPVVIIQWTSVFHFRWNQKLVWIIYFFLALICILYLARSMFKSMNAWLLSRNLFKDGVIKTIENVRKYRISLCLLCIFLITLIIRLIIIRDLAAPPWVDPVHHALLTRIIMEQGQLPNTYSPYVSADNARYHPGYHAMLAVFQWLSGSDMVSGMLIFGQILNALMVLSVFLFTVSLTRNSKTGLLAALIAGVFTPMPAYYTSWGRYTQLAGLVIMPSAIALLRFCLTPDFIHIEKKSVRLSIFFSTGILCAGLFITHYRVIVFLGLFLAAWFMVRHIGNLIRHHSKNIIIHDYLIIMTIIFISMLIAAPWLQGALAELILPKIESSLKADTSFFGHSWSYLTAASGTWTLYLACAGILLGIFTRKRFVWVIIIWVIFLFLMANLNILRLPMSGLINNTSVEISLFLPIAVLAGYISESIIDKIGTFFHGISHLVYLGVVIVGIIVLSFIGIQKILPILNQDTILMRQADLPAMKWIEKNISIDQTILINPFPWGYGLYTGADGGFWITPLTGRKTIPPPLLYGFDTRREIIHNVTQLGKEAFLKSANPVELYNFLVMNDIQYIYIGAKGGELSPSRLKNSQLFNPIYSKDGVWIFSVIQ